MASFIDDKIVMDGLTFDDVLLIPAYSEVLPKMVELKTHFSRNIELNVPFVTAAMDTVTESQMAIAIAREGGIGVIHKNMSIENQAREVAIVKRAENGMIYDPITIPLGSTVAQALDIMSEYHIGGIPVVDAEKHLVGIVTNRDLRFERRLDRPVEEIMSKENLVTTHQQTDLIDRGSKSSATTSSNRTQDYFYYNENHQPTLGVFVIQQNEIPEGTVISSNQQTMTGLYKHQLSWKSNLDDFLPGEEQEYQLWEIVVDEFGIESYQPVYYRNAQGQYTDAAGTVVSKPVPIVLERVDLKEFTFPSVYVDMTAGSQTKTYVIRGRDKDGFLSLQMSNQQEIVIPGLDPNEKAHMIGATYYSRYNPKNQKNCYSNRLELSNNGMQLTADDLSNPIKFYRSSRAAQVDANGNVVTDANGNIQYAAEVKKELVATATATTSGNTGTLTVELANQGIA